MGKSYCIDAFGAAETYRDHPDVIVRPSLVVPAFLAAGFVIDRFGWTVPVYEPAQYLGGGGLIVAAAALMWAAVRAFRDAGMAFRTLQPATAIVAGGPYARFRNPACVAWLLAYIGIGVLANAPAVVALAPLLFAVMHFAVVLREEHYLECRFGDAYLEYRQAVPRWP